MKVKLLTDGGYEGLEKAIGKIFDAIPIKEEEDVLCCDILEFELNKYPENPNDTCFRNHIYYYFLPNEFEVVEE